MLICPVWLLFLLLLYPGDSDSLTPILRRSQNATPLGSASLDEVTCTSKSGRDVEIKQERMDTSSSHGEEESPLGVSKHKKLRIDVADAESNTLNSGEWTVFYC